MQNMELSCRCGQVKGRMLNVGPQGGTRLVCYCDDCQAFARQLSREDVLDAYGGTEIYQIAPCQLQINEGEAQIRSLKLSDKGLIRWYCGCCNTPIGNTVSGALPLVGVIHSFIRSEQDLGQQLGPVRGYVHGRYALLTPPAGKEGRGTPWRLLMRIFLRLLIAKLTGKGQPNPLFDPDGKPVIEPKVVKP
ncbi:DUF6151 family protein [Bowmanella pacifica]|uniref:CENP-V/GFA domain-containing protein n=1 Tax=Bowmanella pacifica TaxID=502051 RepID=A0A917Z348_9ALTE|nr:DUF6151 family protein [Bowmanella pacifica]GGO73081.1 hypothetical protein GCM10010982_32780 [Bowmanella pacifica]